MRVLILHRDGTDALLHTSESYAWLPDEFRSVEYATYSDSPNGPFDIAIGLDPEDQHSGKTSHHERPYLPWAEIPYVEHPAHFKFALRDAISSYYRTQLAITVSAERPLHSLYGEPLPSAAWILKKAPELRGEMLEALGCLEPEPYSDAVLAFHEAGVERFGADWDFLDLPLVVLAASRHLSPARYLEIGVRRGRSMACALRGNPDVEILGIDMWMSQYAGIANPGPEFVEQEMQKICTPKAMKLMSGDSHSLLPNLPPERFDLITVDGDHSNEGSFQDLEDAYRRLNVGGAILFDDIVHPEHQYLFEVWQRFASLHNLDHAIYTSSGYGIAIGIRRHLELTERS